MYGDDSHHSVKGWLKANVNWSNSQVFRRRRLARLLEAYPTVGVSLREGHIGVAQADELARVYANVRVRDQFDESIELLLVQAEQLEFDQAKLCLKRWESFADADGAHNDREPLSLPAPPQSVYSTAHCSSTPPAVRQRTQQR